MPILTRAAKVKPFRYLVPAEPVRYSAYRIATPLADTPWQLLHDALDDLERQEQLPYVCIDMDYVSCPDCDKTGRLTWYRGLAGCLIAERLGIDLTRDVALCNFEPNVGLALMSIDMFGCGEFHEAYEMLGQEMPYGVPRYVYITPYKENPAKFKRQLREVAGRLEVRHRRQNEIRQIG